ncbi:hypothetical protein [Endozoicomonas sp. YOMI1]|uniref:hypothetical protein n=1 Tax=Endozoicomonas sp. YOMI1 TaxID=2828739 RepID=UPI00214925BD|nr:hypothetical protein [Endozoicomonas sp. YOMI1]
MAIRLRKYHFPMARAWFGNQGGLWEDSFLETEKVTLFMPLALKGRLKDHPRLTREYFTVTRMIELYCQHHHHQQHPTLCMNASPCWLSASADLNAVFMVSKNPPALTARSTATNRNNGDKFVK